MSLIAKGNIADITFFLATTIAVVVYLSMYRDKMPTIRAIPQLEAIEEMAGRAAEMNRPIIFHSGISGGWGGGAGKRATDTLAGYSILTRMAEACAKYKAKLIFTSTQLELRPMVQEILENAYRRGGAEGFFDPVDQLHMSIPYVYGWAADALDTMAKENICGNVLIGSGTGATLLLFETGARLGAIQFSAVPGAGGSTAFAASISDHVVLGAEVYAIGAIASGQNELMGTLIGSDIVSWFTILMWFIGMAMRVAGNAGVYNWMNT
jgi:hypothetical protein